MPFSRSKFEKLSPSSQAKKLADLLSQLLQLPDPERRRSELLNEYQLYLSWLKSDRFTPENRSVAAETIASDRDDERTIYAAYLNWRRLAGLGPESALIDSISIQGDVADSVADELDWQVLLPDLRSAHNVGAIIRSVDCFGLGEVLLAGYTPDVEQAGVRAAAMGAESWKKSRRLDDAADYLKNIRPEREIVVLERCAESIPIQDYRWATRGMLVVGNEELGVASELLELAHVKVHIPLFGRKSSLNVSNALAVAAWELRKYLQSKL